MMLHDKESDVGTEPRDANHTQPQQNTLFLATPCCCGNCLRVSRSAKSVEINASMPVCIYVCLGIGCHVFHQLEGSATQRLQTHFWRVNLRIKKKNRLYEIRGGWERNEKAMMEGRETDRWQSRLHKEWRGTKSQKGARRESGSGDGVRRSQRELWHGWIYTLCRLLCGVCIKLSPARCDELILLMKVRATVWSWTQDTHTLPLQAHIITHHYTPHLASAGQIDHGP